MLQKKVFISDIKSIDEKEMTLTAAISSNTIDRMGEVLDPKGVDLKNYQKNPVVLWAHDYSQPPIGKAMWVRRDGETIISKVKFADTVFAREIFGLYKDGYMKSFSVGFIPKDGVAGDGTKGPRYTFTKWELLEYSAVPVPANPDAIALMVSKGIIKDVVVTANDEIVSEFNHEEKIEIKEVEPVKSAPLEDLLADNALLRKEVESLNKENNELRVRLFDVLTKTQKRLSEIAGNDFVGKAHEIITGAIRKAQGKLT